METRKDIYLRQYTEHSRHWQRNLYVYPVLSRRSRGLSIGVNLNPDAACNFDCIYCQVDRSIPPRTREVDLGILERELRDMIELAVSGRLFEDPEFSDVPADMQRVNDIAFSGDGEPTTCPHFPEAVELAARLKADFGLGECKIVLITDACYLTRPRVRRGLELMDRNNGEIWAKLDAGTEKYYQLINRPNYPLQHVIDNIIDAARVRPVVIQAMFLRTHDQPPSTAEIEAFADRLNEIQHAGGRIIYVQVYTVARPPAQSFVTALTNDEVDAIANVVRTRCHLPAEVYYGRSEAEPSSRE